MAHETVDIDATKGPFASGIRPYTNTAAIAHVLDRIPVDGFVDLGALTDAKGRPMAWARVAVAINLLKGGRVFTTRNVTGVRRIYRLA